MLPLATVPQLLHGPPFTGGPLEGVAEGDDVGEGDVVAAALGVEAATPEIVGVVARDSLGSTGFDGVAPQAASRQAETATMAANGRGESDISGFL
ncbi:MAG: hypothetical protein WCB85_04255 [Candidatus Dormiibacterota bacterium]